jgi:hypothetical protein
MRTCPNPACSDRVRLGLAGEYVDSVTVCPQCGAPLHDAKPVAENRAEPETTDVVIEMVFKICSDGAASAGSITSSARPSFSFIRTTPTEPALCCRPRRPAWPTNLPSRTMTNSIQALFNEEADHVLLRA